MSDYIKALFVVIVQSAITCGILYAIQGTMPTTGDMGMALAIGALVQLNRRSDA